MTTPHLLSEITSEDVRLNLVEPDMYSVYSPGVSPGSYDTIRSVLAAAIEQTGVRVHTTGDPEEARQMVTNDDSVALLIIDLETGDEKDSVELLRRIRVALAWARLPALVIVAPHHVQLRHVLEEHGVTDYLVKPVDIETIVSRLRAGLAR